MSDKTLRTGLGLVFASMVLAGCANYHGLNPQGISLDAQQLKAGHSFKNVSVTPAAWPEKEWWSRLGDQQLNSLVAQALRDSSDMQVASARTHQATAAARSANAARMPSLDANGDVTRSRLSRSHDPSGQGGRYSTERDLNLTFNYTFDLWGGQRAAWEAALGEARAAEVDGQAARLTLAGDVARAYSNLGHAFQVRDLSQEDLQRTRKMLDLSKRRLASGIDSHYQFQQTESLEASAQEQLIDAEKQLNSARIALAVLLGKGPDRGQEITRPNRLAPGAVALPSTLPADLLGRRPDVVAARWRVEAASKNIAAAKTRFYPNLNLTAAAGTQSLLGDALFGSASRFFNIAPALTLPILMAGVYVLGWMRRTPITIWRWRSTTKQSWAPLAKSAIPSGNWGPRAVRLRLNSVPPISRRTPTTRCCSVMVRGSVTTWTCSALNSNCFRLSANWLI